MDKNEYFVEIWKESPVQEKLKTYGPYNKHKADKMEAAIDNRIDHEFFTCYVTYEDGTLVNAL